MSAANTIPELFDRAVARRPGKDWLLYEDERYTYAEAAERVAAIAAALAGLGIGRGDLVLATPRNEPAYLFAWLAVVRLGAVIVTANPAGAAPELAGLAGQTRPRLVICDAGLAPAFAGAYAIADVHELAAAPPADAPAGAPAPGDAAVLIPTSGTTGRSKLVTQTHRAYTLAGEGFPYWVGLEPDDRLITVAADLPHQRARVLAARLDGASARASCCSSASPPAASSTRRAATARPSST